MSEGPTFIKINFEVDDIPYSLIKASGKWRLVEEKGPALKSFVITKETYRTVAIEVYELLHGHVGNYGQLVPFIHMLKLIVGDVK